MCIRDSRWTAEKISPLFGFDNAGIENCVDLSIHLDAQDMLHPESFSAILKTNSVRQRTLHQCNDTSKIEAKAERVKLHLKLLCKDMAANPTTIEGCSEYSGSCFKPHFIVESQIEIERLCALTAKPSRMWAEAVRPYTDPGFSNIFGKRHLEGLETKPTRKSSRLSLTK